MSEKTETGLAMLNAKEISTVGELEKVVNDTSIALLGDTGKIAKAFALARGVEAMRRLITDDMMRTYVLPLMNTPLGFKTDKDPKRKSKNANGEWVAPEPYRLDVVKDCIITVMLRGGQLVGNEFNIISGQAYFTKEYFQRALGQLPGVTNIVPSPGIPQIDPSKKAARIRYGLTWKKNGVADSLKDADGKPGRVFEIRCDAYSSTDQIIGKADRKAYAAAYRQIVGSDLAIQDGDVGDLEAAALPAPVAEKRSSAAEMNKFIDGEKVEEVDTTTGEVKTDESGPESDGYTETTQSSETQDAPQQQTASQQAPHRQENPAESVEAKPEKQSGEDDVSTYTKFYELAESIAIAKSVDSSLFSRSIGMALMHCGMKGKQEKTTEAWRKQHLEAMRGERFNWETGQIE